VLTFRRGAVGIEDEVLIAVVRSLERRSGLDVDEAARGHVLPLRRVTEVHREGPAENDERLLLQRMPVAASLGARLITPDVRAGMGKARPLAQLGDVASRILGLMWARNPLKLIGTDHPEGHFFSVTSPACRQVVGGCSQSPLALAAIAFRPAPDSGAEAASRPQHGQAAGHDPTD
jgi:hypothetical protein